MTAVDVVVVGGGVAGASLATVLARRGADVVVLERQATYRDHVRGELLWPWGVREARALDLESVLLGAGANRATILESHSEDRASPSRNPVEGAGITGSLNLAHATTCRALADAARDAGATVLRGVRTVTVTPGDPPHVEYGFGAGTATVTPRLVVGADGRTSAVRRQVGIPFELDAPDHLVTGLLVEGVEGDDDVNVVAREGDTLFLAFPQRAGQARLYHCFPTRYRDRFSGRHAATRFLEACAFDCLPDAELWSTSRPAGPCGTFPACDARAASPAVPGVVLVGDAAGYENPLLGQGLSMALRDVRDVAAALVAEQDWGTPETFASYAADRTFRHAAAKLATQLDVWASEGYERQDPAVRGERYDLVEGDPLLGALQATIWGGYDDLPAELTEDAVAERLGW